MNLDQPGERANIAEPPLRKSRVRFHGARVALALALAVFTYVLFPASPAVDFPVYEVGSVASDNVIAPFAFSVSKTNAELAKEREAAAATVEPVFDYVPAALDSTRRQLAALTQAVNGASVAADPRNVVIGIQQAAASQGVTLTQPEATYLAQERRRAAMLGAVERVFERWLGTGIASRGALDNVRGDVILRSGKDERRVSSDSILTFSMLISRARLIHPDPTSVLGDGIYFRLLGASFHPTIVPDVPATELRRDDMRRSVPTAKYEVRVGEKIIGANEVVGREEHDKLRALHDALDHRRATERAARRVISRLSGLARAIQKLRGHGRLRLAVDDARRRGRTGTDPHRIRRCAGPDPSPRRTRPGLSRPGPGCDVAPSDPITHPRRRLGTPPGARRTPGSPRTGEGGR